MKQTKNAPFHARRGNEPLRLNFVIVFFFVLPIFFLFFFYFISIFILLILRKATESIFKHKNGNKRLRADVDLKRSKITVGKKKYCRNTVEFQLYRLGQVYITCIVYKKCTGCSQRNI